MLTPESKRLGGKGHIEGKEGNIAVLLKAIGVKMIIAVFPVYQRNKNGLLKLIEQSQMVHHGLHTQMPDYAKKNFVSCKQLQLRSTKLLRLESGTHHQPKNSLDTVTQLAVSKLTILNATSLVA